MLWPEPKPDDSCRYPGERWNPPHHAQEEGRSHFALLAKHAFDDVVLDLHLEPLGSPRGTLTPFLNAHEVSQCHLPGAKRLCKDVRGRDRILDCKIDPHSADRGHGVGGVPDAQKAGPIPLF